LLKEGTLLSTFKKHLQVPQKKRTKFKGTLDYVRKLFAELEVGTFGRWCFAERKRPTCRRERDSLNKQTSLLGSGVSVIRSNPKVVGS
jgi:hypothetical protein